ncbi:aminoglycoside phosphotransferase family protein [Candidatus Woesearchaeota archaeon]|nr:aminoglycoside phosphotransferase family protein [Candidatus Woesearchaeota archaeon]
MEHLKKHLKELFLKELQATISQTEDYSKGVDQQVLLVHTDKGDFIYKKPLREADKIIKEKIGCRIAKEQGAPAPEIIFSNDKELIETVIPGKIISEWKLSKEERLSVFRKIGTILKRFHQAKAEGFGPVQANGKGKYQSAKEFIYSWLNKELTALEENKILSTKELENLKQYFSKHEEHLNEQTATYLHADISDYNILINKEQHITGFVDFGDLLAGPVEMDFATWSSETDDLDEVEALIKGYGKTDKKKIAYYSACWMVWMLNALHNDDKIERVKILRKRLYDIIEGTI